MNIGLSNNFNLLIKKSEGKYFSWIGAHDVYDKFYVEKLLSKIIKDDKTSVVFSNVSNIRSNNEIIIEKMIGILISINKRPVHKPEKMGIGNITNIRCISNGNVPINIRTFLSEKFEI